MATYPRIQSPCPYIDRLASIMDGETCRMCRREVFDLTAMSDGARFAFLDGCAGEVCISYRLPAHPPWPQRWSPRRWQRRSWQRRT